MLNISILCFNQDLKQREFSQFLSLMTDEKRKRIEQFHFYIDAQRTLLGDVLARYSICKHFNLVNADLHFTTNEYGKPFLINKSNIQYNISHSGNYVACVISEGSQVGIDIEEIKQNKTEIAKRFFTKDEYDYLVNQSANLQTEIFYQLWTQKESYIKMIGKGLSIPLDSFSVLYEASSNRVYFQQFLRNEEVIGYTCTDKEDTVSYEDVNCPELLSWSQT